RLHPQHHPASHHARHAPGILVRRRSRAESVFCLLGCMPSLGWTRCVTRRRGRCAMVWTMLGPRRQEKVVRLRKAHGGQPVPHLGIQMADSVGRAQDRAERMGASGRRKRWCGCLGLGRKGGEEQGGFFRLAQHRTDAGGDERRAEPVVYPLVVSLAEATGRRDLALVSVGRRTGGCAVHERMWGGLQCVPSSRRRKAIYAGPYFNLAVSGGRKGCERRTWELSKLE
ncbi:unnamed protein product, partial [Mycena citricolor]